MNKVVSVPLTIFSRCCRLSVLVAALATFAHAKDSQRTADLPKLIYADPQALADAKSRFLAGNTSLKPAFDRLFADAQKALAKKPVSVMDKDQLPPSGDKHDFISQAPYFWRDTNSADGRYIRRDGERNPESGKDSDAGHIGAVCSSVHTLALAYYFTGNESYAAHAAEMLRVWFLNPATHMNPNLNYGQGVPGEVDGRPMGIIGTRGFVELVDAIRLLNKSQAWSSADQKGMVAWMTQYLNWLQTSKIGIGEGNASNNHGTFYDTQVAALAVFVGKTQLAKDIITTARQKRIAKQIEPDGKMPRELQRTKSFSYSVFNLRALTDLASIGQNLGIDLWHFQTSDGRSIRKALDFMAPYASRDHQWPYQQIDKPKRGDLVGLLLRAAPEYPGANYEAVLKNLRTGDFLSSEEHLLFKVGAIEIKNVTPNEPKDQSDHGKSEPE